MQASGAVRRENPRLYPPSLRAKRSNPFFLCAAPWIASLLAMTRIGRGVPDTPACVGYHAPFGPRKILQPAARSRFRSRPCERAASRFKLTMTDRSVIL